MDVIITMQEDWYEFHGHFTALLIINSFASPESHLGGYLNRLLKYIENRLEHKNG